MAGVSFKNISKIYQNGTAALSDISLDIADGEFVVLLGPSGSGKSTLLRLVAGLEEPSSGVILLDGKPAVSGPEGRDIAMMFQHYGLKPNLTVYGNLAYGLRLRGIPVEEIDIKVRAAAAELNLTALLELKPKKLSEQERRRAGLARAFVRKPAVFLLDDPLAGLCGSARIEMRAEIIRLQKRLQTTFIYATRDPVEAMTMGKRVVVLSGGEMTGCDAPQSLYDNPGNLFTAAYLGEPQMNFFKSLLTRENGKIYAAFGENKIAVPPARARRLFDEAYIGKEVTLGIRPEDLHAEEVFIAHSPETVIRAAVDSVERFGFEAVLYLKINGKQNPAAARVDARSVAAPGDEIKLALDGNRIHFFDPETGYSIAGLPRTNRLFCELSQADDGAASVKFGDTEIRGLGGELKISAGTKKDARLEIDPAAVTEKAAAAAAQLKRLQNGEEPDETEYFEMDASVEFTEKHPLFTAVYTRVAGKRGLIVALLPPDSALSGGDKITLLGKLSEIRLYDIETGNRIN